MANAAATSGVASLDDEQRAAVLHGIGPALVLAGPGAGKTRTLTHRIQHLINGGVDPSAILAVTFTKKAATEMEERLEPMIGDRIADLNLGTIHSACYRLLRSWWKSSNHRPYDIASGGMTKTITSMILDKFWANNTIGLDLARQRIRVQDLSRFFSACRDRLLSPGDVHPKNVMGLVGEQRWYDIAAECKEVGVSPAPPQSWIAAYHNFQKAKADKHMLDFDDMTPMLWWAWKQDHGLLAGHQRRFHHILVDEFQDTSFGQWELLRALASPQNNMFCVGDVDQSIYSFRYARPEFTLQFSTYYPDHSAYHIATNYRSVPEIVEASSGLICKNRERIPMDLRSIRKSTSQDVQVVVPEDDEDEAAWITNDIAAHHSGDWDSVAVLYRVNSYSANMELALLKAGIPYRVVGGLSFFGYTPVADVLAYLRLSIDPTDSDSFARAIQAPPRYLGKVYIRSVQNIAGVGGDLIAHAHEGQGNPRQIESADEFARLVRDLPDNPSKAVAQIRNCTGYDKWFLQHNADDEEEEVQTTTVNHLDRLESIAEGFDSIEELVAYADVVMESASDDGSPRVTLSTIHRSKGLEWPVVYLAGMVDGILPHARSYTAGPSAVEEERRVAYVAMTRAQDRLIITTPNAVGNRSYMPSRFIFDAGLHAW